MIGIQDIGIYIPEKKVDNLTRLSEFETDEAFIREKTGMLQVAHKSDDQETSDLGIAALADLVARTGLELDEIQCLVVCTQNPDGHGLPHTSAIVHGKAGLSRDCAVFDVSLGCSGYVYGLSIMKGFMEVNGYNKGVLITADPYSKVVDENDKNTALLFGDGATATLLSDKPKWNIGKFLFGSDGKHAGAIEVDDTGELHMDGRGVFNFTATVVPKNIRDTLMSNEVDVDEIDLFVLHQGSRYIRDTLVKRLKVAPEKVPFAANAYGNTVSSSIPMILADVDHDVPRILISGFGVGLSWGSCVLTTALRDTRG
ncbi:ketoacyl-ACP synthase III [Thiosocius teredinicola]|uniref:ketoacyl-ACP synthase III n=1 Tax=Thiosocius teredinicola TaxID=1973002 RepID=UPI0009914DB9